MFITVGSFNKIPLIFCKLFSDKDCYGSVMDEGMDRWMY
jgi:hypothetical protein